MKPQIYNKNVVFDKCMNLCDQNSRIKIQNILLQKLPLYDLIVTTLHTCHFFGVESRSENYLLTGRVFNFVSYCETTWEWLYHFINTRQSVRILVIPPPCQRFVSSVSLPTLISVRCYFIKLHFFGTNIHHLFMSLLAVCIISWCDCSCLLHIFKDCVVFVIFRKSGCILAASLLSDVLIINVFFQSVTEVLNFCVFFVCLVLLRSYLQKLCLPQEHRCSLMSFSRSFIVLALGLNLWLIWK